MVSGAAPQELPPEIILLAHFKTHMRRELAGLPNYTCLETTSRFRREQSFRSDQAKMLLTDTVRLEIVYTDHREWYGAPGERNLGEDNPVRFVGSGMMGNGTFGLTLNNLFITDRATFKWRGEEAVDGKPAARYDFHWPRLAGGFSVSIAGGAGTVGEQGSLWMDPQTLDLIRLEFAADDIPPFLPLKSLISSVSYARTRIGASSVLLPQEGDVHMLQESGEETYNRLEFTHCRAFSVQSAIRFDAEPTEAGMPAADGARTAGEAVPALLAITVQLTTPVTEKDAVGTLIEGKVAGDVVRKGKVIIPNGSMVRGRIRRLERYQTGAEFIVGLEFTEVEVSGGSQRFYADLLRMDKSPEIRPKLQEVVPVVTHGTVETRTDNITLPELPGVASFFIQGPKFTVPAGFRTVWRTRGLLR